MTRKKIMIPVCVFVSIVGLLLLSWFILISISHPAVAPEIKPHTYPYQEQIIVRKLSDQMSEKDYKTSNRGSRIQQVIELVEIFEVSDKLGHYHYVDPETLKVSEDSIQFITVNQCHFCIVFSVDDDQDYSELLEDRYEFEVNSAEGKTKDILSSDHLVEPDN